MTPEEIIQRAEAEGFRDLHESQVFLVGLDDQDGKRWRALLIAPEPGMSMPAEMTVAHSFNLSTAFIESPVQ